MRNVRMIVVLVLALALFAVAGTALAQNASQPVTTGVALAAPTPAAEGKAWLGLTLVNLTEKLAERFNLSQKEGVAVAAVTRNSPAEQAGVQRADIITAVNGQTVKTSKEVVDLVAAAKPGDVVTLSILRKNESLTIKVTAGTAPQAGRRLPLLPTKPAQVAPSLPPELRVLEGIPSGEIFNHIYGFTFTFADKDNKVVVVNVIPGKVTAISPTSITIAPNNPQAKGGPFGIDGTTRIIAGVRAGGTDSIKVDDKVAIVVVGDSTHASMIYREAQVPGVPDFLRPAQPKGWQWPQLPDWNFRLPFRNPLERFIAPQPQPAPGSGA